MSYRCALVVLLITVLGINHVRSETEETCFAIFPVFTDEQCVTAGCLKCAIDNHCHAPTTACNCQVFGQDSGPCVANTFGVCAWCAGGSYCYATATESCTTCTGEELSVCQAHLPFCRWCHRGASCQLTNSYNASLCQYCTSAATSEACAGYVVNSAPSTPACAWCSTIGSGICYDSIHYTPDVCPNSSTNYVSPIPGEMFLYPLVLSTEFVSDGGVKLNAYLDLPQTYPYARTVASTGALIFTKYGADDPSVPEYTITTSNGPTGDLGQHLRVTVSLSPAVFQASYSPKVTTSSEYTYYTWAATLTWTEKAVVAIASRKRDDLIYDRTMTDTVEFSISIPKVVSSASVMNATATSTMYAAVRRTIATIPQAITFDTPAIIYLNFITRPVVSTLYIKQANIAVVSILGTWNVSVSTPLVLNGYTTTNLQEWNVTILLYSNPCTLTPQDGFVIRFKLSGISSGVDGLDYIQFPISMASTADWCSVSSHAITFTGTQQTYEYGTEFDGTNDPITTYYWLGNQVNVMCAWSPSVAITTPTIVVTQVYITGAIADEPTTNIVDDGTNRWSYATIESGDVEVCTGLVSCYRFTLAADLFSTPATTGSPIVITTHVSISFAGSKRSIKAVTQSTYNARQASIIGVYLSFIYSAAFISVPTILLLVITAGLHFIW